MNSDPSSQHQVVPSRQDEWRNIVAPYQEPSTARAVWQLINTLGSYILLWGAMYWGLRISWWAVLPVVILAGGLLVRLFIIFHDCGHGSFFRSRRANEITGFVTGMLTFTPFYHWRWEHSLHHATSGNLDKRGTGDVWTMTVQEYLESSRLKRLAYRLARNPVILFIIAPVFLFTIRQRFPSASANRRERHSVWWMNLAILAMVVSMSWIFGWLPYLLLQLGIWVVGGAAGVWMFYVQHQFEDAYWERREDWDFTAAALQGSSFYKLPRVLQWFSGNIGYHHVHHLSSRIPNYHLERCHNSHPLFQQVKPVTLRTSFKSLRFRLWDEAQHKLIGFEAIRGRGRARRERRPAAADSARETTGEQLPR